MTLLSPGVEVQVTDESFYLPAGAGTVPLIFAPTSSNKSNGSNTGPAIGTLDSNAGRVFLISSQLELTNTFGVPYFETDASGNPVHGGERNEYGLQAAYSALGVTSQVYVVRPAVDLAKLAPTISAPQGTPQSNAQWLDTDNSMYGIGEWNASSRLFVNKQPLVIDDDNSSSTLDGEKPAASFGSIGDYAVVVTKDNTNSMWYKNRSNNWVLLGSNEEDNFGINTNTSTFIATSWQTSWPVAITTPSVINTASSVSINGQTVTFSTSTTATAALSVAQSINNQMMAYGVGARVVGNTVELYADATASYNGVPGVINLTENPTVPDTPGIMQILGFGATTSTTFSAVTLSVNSYNRIPNYSAGRNPTGSVFVNTSPQNNGASWVVKTYNAATDSWVSSVAPVYTDTAQAIKMLDTGGGKNIVPGKVIVESNYNHGTGTALAPIEATFKLYSRVGTGATTIRSTPAISTVSSVVSFQMNETVAGMTGYHNTATVTVQIGPLQNIVSAISAAGFTNITAAYDASTNTLSISHKLGGEFKLDEITPNILSVFGFSTSTANLYLAGEYEPDGFAWRASNWKPLTYTSSAGAPQIEPEDGTLWFNPTLDEVDIMYHNGTSWVGYRNAFPNTDSAGPIISATRPTQQVGGHNGNFDLVDGDIWIDTSDLDKYGVSVYVWNSELSVPDWVLQDTSDNTSINGWLFADARWSTSGAHTEPASISALLSSNYLDPDAPDPDLYPQGMRLWNLRRSSNNVKRYARNYINIYDNQGQNARTGNESMDNYATARWVTASPNKDDGSGSFGRFAQRGVVVRALKSMIDANLAIRDTDTLVFNLMATPGYPETIANMVALNVDRGQTALVIGDTPFRLQSSATELSSWATNFNGAFDNGEMGAVTYDEYLAMFYPSGFTTDNFGNSIVVPPSHMMLRTFITSDQKSYQWFAPAGIRRGGVDNATSVGYIVNGEFRAAALPNNTRDVMYQTAKINPIATLPGSGIVNFGNLTRARTASAMDRINVARLVCYLRRQLDILCRPFLFEPNDSVTRNELKSSVESFLLELVGQRALYDFAVVCDDSNNTPARIDRNELWLDIAVEPVKSVEFIYIPLRLLNTGAIAGG